MKVAIIGAGVSGLACACRLNQLGIKPVIFEKKPIIGEAVNLYGIHLNCFNHISGDPLRLLNRKYHLRIRPMTGINKVKMIAGNSEVKVQGRLGYIFNRGAERTSLEMQLFNQGKADFYMDTYINESVMDDIREQFDAVVVATGDTDIADSFGILKEQTRIQIRCALMDGRYEPAKITTWVKTEYSGQIYVYVVPVSEKKAVMTLMRDNCTPSELDYQWKQMLNEQNIYHNIDSTWDSEYFGGRLTTNRQGNMYFTGNSGGMTDDFLGFGIINGIFGGIFTAEAIVLQQDYQKKIEPILRQVDQLHNLRLLADRADKEMWSRLITILGLPGIRHLIYRYPVIRFQHLGHVAGALMRKQKKP